jgi:hypothetical protein
MRVNKSVEDLTERNPHTTSDLGDKADEERRKMYDAYESALEFKNKVIISF